MIIIQWTTLWRDINILCVLFVCSTLCVIDSWESHHNNLMEEAASSYNNKKKTALITSQSWVSSHSYKPFGAWGHPKQCACNHIEIALEHDSTLLGSWESCSLSFSSLPFAHLATNRGGTKKKLGDIALCNQLMFHASYQIIMLRVWWSKSPPCLRSHLSSKSACSSLYPPYFSHIFFNGGPQTGPPPLRLCWNDHVRVRAEVS